MFCHEGVKLARVSSNVLTFINSARLFQMKWNLRIRRHFARARLVAFASSTICRRFVNLGEIYVLIRISHNYVLILNKTGDIGISVKFSKLGSLHVPVVQVQYINLISKRLGVWNINWKLSPSVCWFRKADVVKVD